MKKLFLDTGAFLAKELTPDQHHDRAVESWKKLAEGNIHLFSSEHVLDETITLLARRTHAAWAATWAKDALGSGIDWISTDPQDLKAALELLRKYADQAVSYTDCLSFVLMKKEGIRDCFTFDRHFQSAGFQIWEGLDR